MNFTDEFESLINQVFQILGKPLDKSKYKIIDRGVPHAPKSLPSGMMGVYIFLYNGTFLKIGKAGPSSNARFLSQHYNPKSAQSTLAASILSDVKMQNLGINEVNIANWIKNECQRIDILLESSLGIFTLELIEAILHFKYEPNYEGFSTQRQVVT